MFEEIRNIVCSILSLDESEVTEESNFIDDFGADSIDIVQMVVEIEHKFEVLIDEDDIVGVKTVGDAVRLVERKLK